MSNTNKPVPGAESFYPLNEPDIGSLYPDVEVYPQNANIPILFQPLILKGVTFKNRIFVSPMCQYSSDDGHATDWHLVHIGGFATRGAGAVCMEATAVVAEGRISPEDAGIWTDSQIPPLERIVKFAHTQGTRIGIQLAHAGRKSSTLTPWVQSAAAKSRAGYPIHVAQENENGWPNQVYAPSDIPYLEGYPHPIAMTENDMQNVEDAFVAALERCKRAGFDFIEIHAAHGYLLHEFVSPLSNIRTDDYGGSLENRLRFPLRIIKRCRAAWSKPLFVRISAADWADGPEKVGDEWTQWGIEQSTIFVKQMYEMGIDLVDCSSGGNWARQRIPVGPGYQVHFAEALKKACPELPIGSVGLITDPHQAESYLQSGKADVVFLARELIRNPHWPIFAAQELGVVAKPANQYERGWSRMLTPRMN